MSLLDLMQGLAESGVRVVLVGGMAARVHGAQRVTDDVDVCYDPAAQNITKLVNLLRGWDAYPRDMAPGRPYTLSRAHLAEHDTIRLVTRHGPIDVMRVVPGLGGYRDVVAHCDTMQISNGLTMPVINLEKLIRAKETASRGKDIEALHELRALRALTHAQHLEDHTHGAEPAGPASPPPVSQRDAGFPNRNRPAGN